MDSQQRGHLQVKQCMETASARTVASVDVDDNFHTHTAAKNQDASSLSPAGLFLLLCRVQDAASVCVCDIAA